MKKYYIYAVDNLRIPYYLDGKPAEFDTRRKAERMCDMMNYVIKGRSFVVVCRIGLILGAKVSTHKGLGVIIGTRIRDNGSSLIYTVKLENGECDDFCDYALERVVE